MKNWIKTAIAAVGALCVTVFLSACPGSGSSSSNNVNTCGFGYVSTGYGCLPQANCPYGQGYNAQTGQCIAGTPGGGGSYTNYTTFTGYMTSFINSYVCQDFLFRVTGYQWNTCPNNMTVSLQTMGTSLPTQGVLTIVIGNYQGMAVIQGTVNPINSNSQAQFLGQYGTVQIGLRMQGLLTATSLTSYLSENGQDFANVQLNKMY